MIKIFNFLIISTTIIYIKIFKNFSFFIIDKLLLKYNLQNISFFFSIRTCLSSCSVKIEEGYVDRLKWAYVNAVMKKVVLISIACVYSLTEYLIFPFLRFSSPSVFEPLLTLHSITHIFAIARMQTVFCMLPVTYRARARARAEFR